MAYALLQKHLATPEIETLKRAFRALPELRELDAHHAAHEAHGIFLRGLDVESASLLQDALLREGMDTWVVAESELPAVPPARVIRHADFLTQHLTMYDPMRRAYEVPWQDIMFLAAGKVRLQEFKRVKTSHESPQVTGPGIAQDTVNDLKSRTEVHDHLLLDIVLLNGATRYSINADEFVFDCLGLRCSEDRSINFARLVQDLVKYAPHAGLNRGALIASEQDGEPFSYPSKAAFFAEMTWMLWRIDKLAKREDL